MLFVFLGDILILGLVLVKMKVDILPLMIVLLILLITASFSLLKVIVNKDYLQIKFGWGIFGKKFLLREIVSAKIVRNHWYYGWGIRFVYVHFKSPTLIYNVSGFDAVEIMLKNGKIYRIGTDEPKELSKAILRAKNKR